jgi:predicted permease
MLRLPLELLPCLSLGLVLGVARPAWPAKVIPPLIHWGLPLSLAALLLRSPFSVDLLKVGLLGVLVPVLSLWIVRFRPLRQRLQHRVLLLGATLGNTGYWGLPVALALLPPRALGTVIAYDLAGTIVTWSLGPLVLRGNGGGTKALVRTLLTSPALQGVGLAALLVQTPWREVVAQSLWWPARGVFWLALAVVGMRLGVSLNERSLTVCSGLTWALGFKLLVVPGILWILATALDLPPLDRTALVLQGATPTALSVLLLAEVEGEAVALASSVVLLSTGVALLTVPLWWSVLR